MEDIFAVAGAVIISVGGAGVLIFALSSWLGKLWAQRILQNEKVEHDRELTKFKNELDALAERKALNYQQKIELYKIVSSPLVDLVALINRAGLLKEHVEEFDRQRLHITTQLGLFAPQEVFDAFSDMVDYLYNALEQDNFEFAEFRTKGLGYLTAMRRDIGIYTDELQYNGSR